jgi:hypothetical protein
MRSRGDTKHLVGLASVVYEAIQAKFGLEEWPKGASYVGVVSDNFLAHARFVLVAGKG